MEGLFQMEGNEYKDRERLKCVGENSCQSEEGALAWHRQLRLGPWQRTTRDLWQPREILRGRREGRKGNNATQGRGSTELG